jgi:predicted SAM-dependent methyltransferase
MAARRPFATIMIKICFGSGGVALDGWIHVDWNMACRPDVVADCGGRMPFADGVADFLHSEDFLDQLPMARAEAFIDECHRILRPDGVMRLLTPDLRKLVDLYLRDDPRLLELWEAGVGLPLRTRTLGEVVNEGIRRCGHEFVYDETTLRALIEPRGFTVDRVEYNQSGHPELRGMDQRGPGNALSMYFECRRA